MPLCEAACEAKAAWLRLSEPSYPKLGKHRRHVIARHLSDSVDILRAPADAVRAHLAVRTAMISGRSPVCLTRARVRATTRAQALPAPFLQSFGPCCWRAWRSLPQTSPGRGNRPIKRNCQASANLLADEALDPKGVASPSDGASPAAERAPNSSLPSLPLAFRAGLRAAGHNQIAGRGRKFGSGTSVGVRLCRRFGSDAIA
mgnify:CR=1 FL=1